MRRSTCGLAIMALVATLALAACGGGSSATKATGSTVAQGKPGGTLKILFQSDFTHLDPQRNYVSQTLAYAQRLLYRSLTGFKSEPGPAGSDIVPDLAKDLGTASDNNKTWTFALRPGLKYEDGTPITCADVKYGVERSFSDQITDGPQYAIAYLEGGRSYKGPYKDNGAGLSSIVCKDDLTIVFHLARGIGDFAYTVSLPTFSPVPKAKDTNVKYDDHPISSGPYKIESYVREKSIVLVRNTYWDAKTDPIRKAYPDRIEGTFGIDPTVIDQRLIADAPQDQTAIQLDSQVQAENLATVVSQPQLKARAAISLTAFVRYLAINTTKVTDLKVRQAIEYAVNRESYRGTRGGANAGDYATSMISPALKAHKDFNVYPAPPTGDPAKARQLLTEAGKVGLALKLDLQNTPQNSKSGAALKTALDAAGFRVTLNPINNDVYYSTISKTAVQSDLSLVAWGPDWPSGSSVIPPLFDGSLIVPQGNQNYAQLNDPQVQSAIAAANAETDLTKQAKMWGDLDQLVMEKAAVVPLIVGKDTQLVGSKVKGAFIHSFYGCIDPATLSVA